MQSMSSRDNVNKIFTKYNSSSLQTCPSNHLTSLKGDIKYFINMRGCEMAMIPKYKYKMQFYWWSEWIREIGFSDNTIHNIFCMSNIVRCISTNIYSCIFTLCISLMFCFGCEFLIKFAWWAVKNFVHFRQT